MEFFKGVSRIDFMGIRKLTAYISMVFIVASIVAVFTLGLNRGIDFTGGMLIGVTYEHNADLDKVRHAMGVAGFKKFEAKHFGKSTDVDIFIPPAEGETVAPELKTEIPKAVMPTDVKDKLKVDPRIEKVLVAIKSTSDKEIKLRSSDVVGSQVGKELIDKGFLALLITFICILAYVSVRYEFKFALGAILALFHDPILIVGFFAVTQMEFNLSVVAAILAVIGYSINDTIVVFDRIRENFRKLRKSTTIEVMNISINETLSRTVMTSGTTLLVVLSLLFFGGEALRGFSTAIVIGIVVGTYSSIYVASTLALWMGASRQDMLKVKKEGVGVDERP